MLEVILFAVLVALYYRSLGQLSPTRAGVVKAEKTSPQLAQLLANAEKLFEQKKYVSAEKAFLNVLKFDHKNIQAYRRLGSIYLAQKNYEDSIECLQITAQLAPSAASYYNLGHALAENHNNIKAIAAYEKSTMFEPAAVTYTSLAKAHRQMNNRAKALLALERAAELEPNKAHLAALGEAYLENHERVKAEETYGKILKIDPTDAKARRIAGNTQAA